jgi:hypothetical protein
VVDKSTNNVQFRQIEKSIQKISKLGIGFGNRPIADFFCMTKQSALAIVKISQ